MPPTASGVRPVQRTSRSRTIAGSARSSRPDQAPELKIERGSERPGRQAVADGQPMQPARDEFVGLMDPRRPANGPTGGRGSRGWTSMASNSGSVDIITAKGRAAASRAGAKAGHARAPRSRPFMICPAPSRMGLGRRPRDDPDNLADQPFGQGEDRARDRLVRKARSPGQRQGRFKTVGRARSSSP